MMPPRAPAVVLVAVLLVSGCGGSTAGNAPTPAPAPRPGDAEAPAPTTPGRGPAVTYKAVRNVGYRLERHDSLRLQYPGGATQEQVRDRIAFLRVTVTESPTPGAYQVAIVLDSLQALEDGQPVSPDSVAATRGTRWTATLTRRRRPRRAHARSHRHAARRADGPPAAALSRPAGGWRARGDGVDRHDRIQAHRRRLPGQRARRDDLSGRRQRRAGRAERRSRSRATAPTTGPAPGTRATRSCRCRPPGNARARTCSASTASLISARGSESGDMTITVPTVGQTVPVKQSGSYAITSSPSR